MFLSKQLKYEWINVLIYEARIDFKPRNSKTELITSIKAKTSGKLTANGQHGQLTAFPRQRVSFS